jgi:SAM-dependent methyltransferase
MTESKWDERYRSGSYTPREYPSDLLVEYIDWLPDGTALDIATGNGRNAIYLANQGYDVDAVDISEEALRLARDRAADRSVTVNWIEADYEQNLPTGKYDVITMSFVQPVSYRRFTDIKQLLAPDGVLIHEHHVTSPQPVDGGSDWKWRSNDLLRLCSDLVVVYFSEAERTYNKDKRSGETALVTSIIAKNGSANIGEYPKELPIGT